MDYLLKTCAGIILLGTEMAAENLKHFTENIDAVSIASHFGIEKTRIYEIAKESYGIGLLFLGKK